MKKIILALAFATLPLCLIAAPDTIRFQGRLTDNNGIPIVGSSVTVQFLIYDLTTGGSLLWQSPLAGQQVASNSAGLFSTDVGPIPSTIFNTTGDVFMEVKVRTTSGGFQTLSPRQKLSSVPYALHSDYAVNAGTATTVADDSITTDKIVDETITGIDIASNTITGVQLASGSVSNSKITDVDGSKITGQIDSAQIGMPGVIVAYGGNSAPNGWLFCNGQAVSRATYANLFAAIGVAYGAGDGSTTFNVPDFRGRFLRGVDEGSGRDPDASSRTAMASGGNTGNNVGSVQNDQVGPHNHSITDPGHSHQIWGDITLNLLGGGRFPSTAQNSLENWINTESATTNISINNSPGSESRPINAYVKYVIKY